MQEYLQNYPQLEHHICHIARKRCKFRCGVKRLKHFRHHFRKKEGVHKKGVYCTDK